MPRHRITNADDVRTGNAVSADRTVLGVPVSNVVYDTIVNPIAAANTSFINAATGAELPNAATKTYTFPIATATSPQDGANITGVQDVERAVRVVSSHASSVVAMTVTVYGTDRYGAPLRENIAVAAGGTGATVEGVKAFKKITRVDLVAAGDATANTISVGVGLALGLAFAPRIGGYVRTIRDENTADSATYAAPPRTAQTATSVNPRGTITPQTAADGTKTYTAIYVSKNGPDATDAFGLAQYNG